MARPHRPPFLLRLCVGLRPTYLSLSLSLMLSPPPPSCCASPAPCTTRCSIVAHPCQNPVSRLLRRRISSSAAANGCLRRAHAAFQSDPGGG
uniref:Secreted protein n=1 Tax=Arundo donax TaxID=35708 RepID=A0A0A8YMM9_ARUDO